MKPEEIERMAKGTLNKFFENERKRRMKQRVSDKSLAEMVKKGKEGFVRRVHSGDEEKDGKR